MHHTSTFSSQTVRTTSVAFNFVIPRELELVLRALPLRVASFRAVPSCARLRVLPLGLSCIRRAEKSHHSYAYSPSSTWTSTCDHSRRSYIGWGTWMRRFYSKILWAGFIRGWRFNTIMADERTLLGALWRSIATLIHTCCCCRK